MPITAKVGLDLIKNDLDAITRAIEKEADGIRLVSFNTVKGELTRRIFNQGTATDGAAIGQYKPSTKKTREKTGRQTTKVDLEMTGTLRKSLTVGTAEGRTVIGILEQPEPTIKAVKGRLMVVGTSDFSTSSNAIYQEKNFKKEIFAPSEQEITRGEKTIVKEMDRVVQKALASS